MLDQLTAIIQFMAEAFIHIWPYLLITIPIAVAVQLSGAARYINKAFSARPLVAILLATAVGAFSPFCSCGVIPVVAALLIGGVPLAPVMAFWVASPSMDPEIFFLSVGTLGWQLAIWRLASTLVLSLSAGFITHFLFQRGWLGDRILRDNYSTTANSRRAILRSAWQRLRQRLAPSPVMGIVPASLQPLASSDHSAVTAKPATIPLGEIATVVDPTATEIGSGCGDTCGTKPAGTGSGNSTSITIETEAPSFGRRLAEETWKATSMVVKFMALAFFLEALITLYVPSEWIVGLLGYQNPAAIPTAALLGVPVYTSNLAALPMVSGLLAQGMNPAAALAFLVAGPTTTLPAMAAVWGLTTRRVFALYVSFSLAGAVALGYVYAAVALFQG